MIIEYNDYRKQIFDLVNQLCKESNFQKGEVIVLGCSTSEILGSKIGKSSSEELGVILAEAFIQACNENCARPALQCCEHLNRALVSTNDVCKDYNLTQVNVKPQLHAGGGVATAAYNMLDNVCMIMNINAKAAIDIGDTLIGMHVRPVAVPLRPENHNKKVGHANVVMAYSRLPYIGGPRAAY